MTDIAFNFALFQGQFPEFVDPPYTSILVEAQWNIATCYISVKNCGSLTDACRAFAINAMTAHLFKLQTNSANVPSGGKSTGFVQQANIAQISVSIVAPPTNASQFHWWLNQTAYGQQLLALLKAKSVGGLYVGGRAELSSFRKSGGVF